MTLSLLPSHRNAAWLAIMLLMQSYSPTKAFAPLGLTTTRRLHTTKLDAAPKRLEENVDGVVYVNDKCINCSTCSHFAPSVFERSPTQNYHIVHHQPETPLQVDQARAALAACPVAAIRVETEAHRHHRGLESLSEEDKEVAKAMALAPKRNGLELPFPRPLAPDVYFVGYHNEKSFGATPYLTQVLHNGDLVWIMVDSPKFSKLSKDAVTSLTGPDGPDYLMLTHVDDSAGHNDWKAQFPSLKRIFHAGDLGRYNWIGDETLNDVEILLPAVERSDDDDLTMYSLDGTVISSADNNDAAVILHTPGHSPGSISLFQRPKSKVHPGILFTGDTYAFTTASNSMTAFPRYGNNLRQQAKTLKKLLDFEWDIIAAGHGHHRDYTHVENKDEVKRQDVEVAIDYMKEYSKC